jgi:hypothetical protein
MSRPGQGRGLFPGEEPLVKVVELGHYFEVAPPRSFEDEPELLFAGDWVGGGATVLRLIFAGSSLDIKLAVASDDQEEKIDLSIGGSEAGEDQVQERIQGSRESKAVVDQGQ